MILIPIAVLAITFGMLAIAIAAFLDIASHEGFV